MISVGPTHFSSGKLCLELVLWRCRACLTRHTLVPAAETAGEPNRDARELKVMLPLGKPSMDNELLTKGPSSSWASLCPPWPGEQPQEGAQLEDPSKWRELGDCHTLMAIIIIKMYC